jgi:hypothetical protein
MLVVAIIATGCAQPHVPAPTVNVRGAAFKASFQSGVLPDAEISILELPDWKAAVTGPDGTFAFSGLPGDSELTFVARGTGLMETMTATFRLTKDLDNLVFQVPDPGTYNLLSQLAGVTLRDDRCQIATTVTRRGLNTNDTGGNGEPDATVSLDPPAPSDSTGPLFFNIASTAVIYPDPQLERSTSDGGVLFLNVPAGRYVLRAEKPGTTFAEVPIKCVAGRLTNAAPPWGLSALSGGIGPRPEWVASDGG